MGMVSDAGNRHAGSGHGSIFYRTGGHDRNRVGVGLVARGEWRGGSDPGVSHEEVGWNLLARSGRNSRNTDWPARGYAPCGWGAGMDIAFCILLYCHRYFSYGRGLPAEISQLGVGCIRRSGHTSVGYFTLGGVALVRLLVSGNCRRDFIGLARMGLCDVGICGPQPAGAHPAKARGLRHLIGEVMANTGAGSHTEPQDIAATLRPEAASGQGQEEKTMAHSGDSFAAWEKTKAERDELLDRLARTQAEFENTRKRLNREQDEFKELALADAIKSLLPVLDGFDWAIQSPYQNVEDFRSGINLIRKQLQDSLSNLGLRSIPADGEPFDPRLHQAVEVVNTSVAQDNQVLKDVRRGYKLKDRLLRPAMVLVAHNPESDAKADAQGEQSQRP